MGAELRGQDSIERGRRPPSLQVSQDDATRFPLQAMRDLVGHDLADATQPGVMTWFSRRTGDELTGRELCPFRHNHQGEPLSLGIAIQNFFANVLEAPGDFRNQDHVAAAGNACVEGNPAGIAAHDFEHHGPFVTGGRGVQTIESVGGAIDGAIEAEGESRGRKVVVDRLGNTDDGDARLMELLGDS